MKEILIREKVAFQLVSSQVCTNFSPVLILSQVDDDVAMEVSGRPT